MKKLMTIIIVLFVFIMSGNTLYAESLQPISDFSNWTGESWYGDTNKTDSSPFISSVGNAFSVNIPGDQENYIWTGLYQMATTDTRGMLATINVSKINGSAQVGIVDSIGKIGNNRIVARMYVEQWLNNNKYEKRVRYTIRERDLNTGERRQLSSGVIGEWDGGWNLGDSVTVGFMRTGNDFWFYLEGMPGFVKWTSSSTVESLNESLNWSPEVFGYTGHGADNAIEATVSNIYIIKK